MSTDAVSDAAPAWYVLRAYKAEKKAEAVLEAERVEHFIAKKWAVRVYHGRKGRYLVPAIPSLVFVKATREELKALKAANPFMQYVMDLTMPQGVPLSVPAAQMDSFIKIASHSVDTDQVSYLTPDEVDITTGTSVRIHGGIFDGAEGRFVRVKGKRDRRVVVELSGLGTAVAAEVHPDLIEILK